MSSTTVERGPRGSAHLSLAGRRRVRGVAGLLIGVGGFLLVWTVLSEFVVGEFLLPPPLEIGRVMWEIVRSGAFIEHFVPTILRLGYGFALALLIGFGVGTVCGLINGLLVVRTGMPAFIVTLAALFILRGVPGHIRSDNRRGAKCSSCLRLNHANR